MQGTEQEEEEAVGCGLPGRFLQDRVEDGWDNTKSDVKGKRKRLLTSFLQAAS
jgi:hypothetical protein